MTNFLQFFSMRCLNSFLKGSLFFLLIFYSLSSCTTVRSSAYFRDIKRDTVINFSGTVIEELKIKKGDILAIRVSSMNRAEDEFYNPAAGAGSTRSGYPVGKEGEIYFHRLGKVKVEGLTRRELAVKLETELRPYLNDPLVVINFENHKVTIIGEIGRPQLYPMPEERIPLIDLMAQSGTPNQFSKFNDILVIREEGSNKVFKRLNLEDNSIFLNSPYYYLQPNDIVVLQPDEKIDQATAGTVNLPASNLGNPAGADYSNTGLPGFFQTMKQSV